MITIVTHDAGEGLREGHRVADLPSLLDRKELVVWVDISAPAKEETALLTSIFRFHPLSVEDCEALRQRPKIDDYQDYLFITTHGVHPDTSVREFRTRQMSIYVGPRFLVTYHKHTSRSVQHVLESVRRNPRAFADGPTSLLYHILDHQVDLYLPLMENFEKKIDEMEDRIFTSPTAIILTEFLDFKKALMRLRRISGHQRELLARLVRREFSMIDERSVFHLRDVHDHLVRVTDLADSYRELLTSVLDVHLSIVSNRTNEIMRGLTIVATLFIPLTFVAGLYGMNFEYMPELKWKYGYYFALGVMVLVGAGMYILFRRRGILPETRR
jgi:magnesium transporter